MIDRRVLLSLGGSVFFGMLILLEMRVGMTHSVPPATVSPKTDSASAAPNRVKTDPTQLVSAILARPLFSSTRRPPQTTEKIISGTFELDGARLTGIVIAADERLAIFDVKGSKPLVLNEGETVSGWRVDSIAPSEVSLVGPGGVKTLQPKLDPSHSPVSAGPAPPVPVRSRGQGREPQH